MPQFFDQISEKIRDRIPERRLLIAPADAFFSARFKRPDGLGRDELAGFAELSLESVSPFPAEQMAWGFVVSDDAEEVFCYGTPLVRLNRMGVEDLSVYHHAFPGFLTQFGLTFERPTCRFLAENGSISAVFYDPRNPIPQRVLSAPVQAEILSDEAITAARARLLKRIKEGTHHIEDGVWIGEGYSIDGDHRFTFHHRHVGNDGRSTLSRKQTVLQMTPAEAWQADLRHADYAVQQRKQRALSAKLWRALVISGTFAAVLLLLQVLNWGMAVWMNMREARIAQQAPVVQRIDNKLLLADRLMQSLTEDLEPVALLDAVNVTRPQNVYFTEVQSGRFDQLVVEGKASDVQAVNDYAEALEKLSYVGSVESNSQTRRGETEFRMTINFTSIPASTSKLAQKAGNEPAAATPDPEDDAS